MTRTQVAIAGAGPAGLMLSHLLDLEGIGSVVVESRSREYIEGRVRAGVLEQGTVDLLRRTGAAARLDRLGLVHHGLDLAFSGTLHRIPLTELTGRSITVYAQQEVVKDLIAARLAAGGHVLFDAEVTAVGAALHYRKDGRQHALEADFIAGCDGFHGVSRTSAPAGAFHVIERLYPFAWLGILAQAPPARQELVYARHERGFALYSMRSPKVTRLYLQCEPEADLNDWDDARIWSELEERLGTSEGWRPRQGPILQKSVTPMRSLVVEPMRHGKLFLAGDAAHIVPPTGAKGLNLAMADVAVLARALARYYRTGDERGLLDYSARCLRRVWKVQRFSWWMTALLHRFAAHTEFDRRRQLADLEYLVSSRAAMTSLAENYVGLPYEEDEA